MSETNMTPLDALRSSWTASINSLALSHCRDLFSVDSTATDRSGNVFGPVHKGRLRLLGKDGPARRREGCHVEDGLEGQFHAQVGEQVDVTDLLGPPLDMTDPAR